MVAIIESIKLTLVGIYERCMYLGTFLRKVSISYKRAKLLMKEVGTSRLLSCLIFN